MTSIPGYSRNRPWGKPFENALAACFGPRRYPSPRWVENRAHALILVCDTLVLLP